jgi:hypothetical protein
MSAAAAEAAAAAERYSREVRGQVDNTVCSHILFRGYYLDIRCPRIKEYVDNSMGVLHVPADRDIRRNLRGFLQDSEYEQKRFRKKNPVDGVNRIDVRNPRGYDESGKKNKTADSRFWRNINASSMSDFQKGTSLSLSGASARKVLCEMEAKMTVSSCCCCCCC